MKKILITGMNKNQCVEDFYLRQQLQVVPSHYSLLRCLRDMGYQVEQRHVGLGENIDEYDYVFVYLASPRQRTAVAFYNGLWAISQRQDCILLFDDWQTTGIYNGIVGVRSPEEMFNQWMFDLALGIDKNFEPQDAKDCEKDLFDAIEIIRSKQNKMLISAFSGGDLSLLIDWPAELLYSYNPNPYHLNRKPVLLTEKQKCFNFASLLQGSTVSWLKKQAAVEWPIKKYGSRKDGQDRLTEDAMCRVYAEQWGCLMPGYKHAGSGWWRARPLQVADAGSILIGDPLEMKLYYSEERLWNATAAEIEKLSDSQLEEFATAQRESLYAKHPLDKSVEQQEIGQVL